MEKDINILLIIVLVILAGSVLWGIRRGFIRVVFTLAAIVLMSALVSWISPQVNDFLRENTSLHQVFTEKCTDRIQQKTEKSIEQDMPRLWSDQLAVQANEAVNSVLDSTGIYRETGEFIADWILKGIACVISFLVIGIVLKLIINLLDLVSKLPLLRGVNRILGAAAGLIFGLLIVWFGLFVVALACTSQWGQQALASIEKSDFLTFLYQNNGVLYLVNQMFQ